MKTWQGPSLCPVVEGRHCALSMVEEPVRLAEDEVVFVPEAIRDLGREFFRSHVVKDIVVFLRPPADRLQGRPVDAAFLGIRRNPGVLCSRSRLATFTALASRATLKDSRLKVATRWTL